MLILVLSIKMAGLHCIWVYDLMNRELIFKKIIFKAAKINRIDILEYFHKQGIKLTVRKDDNATPFHVGL